MERNETDKRSLIISCSKRKKSGKKRAWDLYDGVVFRMLKKIEREKGLPKDLNILILSAKYGLINSDKNIDNYDLTITSKIAYELKEELIKELEDNFSKQNPKEIFCCLGKKYWEIVGDALMTSNLLCPISNANGRIGEKLSRTKDWILNSTTDL